MVAVLCVLPGGHARAEAPEGVAPDLPLVAPAPTQPPSDAPMAEPEGGGPPFETTVRAPPRLLDDWSAGGALTVQVVDSEELAASGARTLQEALQRLPGIHLADEQGNASQQDLSVRGLTASPVTGLPQGLSVFLDGVRVNEPAVEEVNFDLIPLADVERVEIVRGPHAVFGRNTIGGAIHIVTRRGGAQPEAEAVIEGGGAGYERMRGRLAGPIGPLDGYLSFTQSYDRGWRVAGAERSLQAFGKLGVRREDADAALSYQFQLDRIGQPGALPQPMLSQDRSQNYTPGDFFRPALHLLTLNARQRLAPGLSLAVNAFFRALDGEQFNSSRTSPDTRLFDRTRSYGGTIHLDHGIRLGALRNRLTAGAEATRSSVRIAVHEEPNAGFPPSVLPPVLPRLAFDLSDEQIGIAAFLQDQLRVAGGPLSGLGATAALRFDRIAHAIVDASPDAPGRATGNLAYSALVPAAGVTWAFGPDWLASASLALGYRAPAFLELTCADPAAPCIGLQAGVAPDASLTPLRPVRSRTFEVGVSGSPLGGVTATLEAFRIDLQDDIFAVAAPGTNRVVFRNVGDTRRQGVELALRGERGTVQVEASYAYTRATFEGDLTLFTLRTANGVETVSRGAQLPLVPSHHLDLDVRVQALPWLGVSAGLLVVGSQYFRGDEANVGPKLPPYFVLRAGAEARWRAWTAFLRATNLLDARYETFATFAAATGGQGQPGVPFLTPGAPLLVIAGLRWEVR